MMRDQGEKSGLTEWLWPTRLPDFAKAKPLGAALGGMIVLMGMALLAMIVVVFFDLFKIVFNPPAEPDLRGLGILLAGLIGAPFVFWRAIVAQQTVNIAEQNHITDQINKAVEGLGAEKTIKRNGEEETRPNLEVRIGAIYALERIARKNLSEHIQIMEILCAYVRENAPASGEQGPDDSVRPEEMYRWTQTLQLPRTDIQTAMTVIGRRAPAGIALERNRTRRGNPDAYCLDLRATNLQRVDLQRLDFDFAQLDEAQLQRAELNWAQLQGAQLDWARLQEARLHGSQLQGAQLDWAQLQGARLTGTQLQGAQFIGADLKGAQINGAEMDAETKLMGTAFQGAAIRNTNFNIASLSLTQIAECFGDATVTLPDGVTSDHPDWPAHWSKERNGRAFYTQWRAFQKRIGYTPSENPA